MQLEVKKYLFDIVQATTDIERYTSGLNYSGYASDGMVQAAVERKFEVVGEALNRITRLDAPLLQNITDHQRIVDFRNVIAHGYDAVDNELIWSAVLNHLPKLKRQAEQLLRAD
jgi:uncharacterized protein with HEPN domain